MAVNSVVTPLAPLNGIVLLDKPIDFSSNQALQKVKRIFRTKKAGHTGSLDPIATGLLPICLGAATKFSQFLLNSDKSYVVTATLGIETETGDREGEIVAHSPIPTLTPEIIETHLTHFRGNISQIPSMYSALKHQGKPLYLLARQGIEIERPARPITIYEANLLSLSQDEMQLFIHCSKGTYIRTFITDLGKSLGCGAHVKDLRRVSCGPYQEPDMLTLSQLEAMDSLKDLHAYLRPTDSALNHFPAVTLNDSLWYHLSRGQSVRVSDLPADEGLVRLYTHTHTQQFVGIGMITPDFKIAPKRLLNSSDLASFPEEVS